MPLARGGDAFLRLDQALAGFFRLPLAFRLLLRLLGDCDEAFLLFDLERTAALDFEALGFLLAQDLLGFDGKGKLDACRFDRLLGRDLRLVDLALSPGLFKLDLRALLSAAHL